MALNLLRNFYLMESEAVEQGGDAGLGVDAGFVEDAVCDCGLGDLLLRCLAYFGFQVRVGGYKQAGGAGVDARVLVVEARGEDLRRGKMDTHGLARDGDVAGLELGHVDARDDFAVGDEKQLIAGEEVGQEDVFTLAFDDLVDGVDHCFQTREPADLFDDRHGGGVDGGGAAGEVAGQVVPPCGSFGKGDVKEKRSQQDAERDASHEDAEASRPLLALGRIKLGLNLVFLVHADSVLGMRLWLLGFSGHSRPPFGSADNRLPARLGEELGEGGGGGMNFWPYLIEVKRVMRIFSVFRGTFCPFFDTFCTTWFVVPGVLGGGRSDSYFYCAL
jgi:hypothetical protein